MPVINVPVQSTPFIGRTDELAHIAALLGGDACRLLTLVGPGGIGKTRLAIEAGNVLADRFADGVYFVGLQPLNSSEDMLSTIAQALDIRFSPNVDPRTQLLDALRSRNTLLILDNVEHLLDGVDLLADCLAAAPDLRMLATSRERMNLVEEWVFDVTGLRVPDETEAASAEQYSAVALFVRGAERVDRSFSLASEWSHVVRICRLVDGMPLALELASAWVRALPCAEIAAELERSLDILETSARNVLPRHRSMRAVLDTSWRLLTDDERRTFARLSVFRGGFTRDAAESVAGASRHTLAGLVDKSWLRYSSEDGRYDVQELLRQFGQERLDADPDDAWQTHARHCHTYMQMLRDIWPRMAGAHFREASAEIELELENIRTAWVWAVYNDAFDEIDGTLQSLWFFYDRGSRFQDGEALFAKAAARLAAAGAACRLLYGKVLARQAAMLFSLDRFLVAGPLASTSVDILRPLGQDESLAFALLVQGMTLIEEKMNTDSAGALFRQSLDIYRNLNDLWGVAYTLNWLTIVYEIEATETRDRADFQKATEYAQEALDIFQELNNAWGIAVVTSSMSAHGYFDRDYERSLHLAARSLEMFTEIGVHWGRAYAYHTMAEASYHMGDYERARQYAIEGLRVSGSYRLMKYSLLLAYTLAEIELALGYEAWAYELLAFVEQQRERFTHPRYFRFEYAGALEAAMATYLRSAVERGRASDFDSFIREIIERASAPPAAAPTPPAATDALPDPLTERELDVLRLLAEGQSNRQIAARLVIALGTVKTHVHNICGKLGAANRAEAIERARALGLV